MTFEEFFKKKKINLALLQPAEPEFFAELASHYQAMGEKSFDHTKKYWFNLLRQKYHLPDEPKVEKVRMESRLAEQTITESVIEQPEPAATKVGFKPRFKAVAPPVTPLAETGVPEQSAASESTVELPAPKLGFKPKFKTVAASPQPETDLPQQAAEPDSTPEPTVHKLGFKPKFKTAESKPQPVEPKVTLQPEKKADSTEQPKPAYKPRFQAGKTKPPEAG